MITLPGYPEEEARGNGNLPDLEEAVRFYLQDKSDESQSTVIKAGSGLVHHFVRLYTAGQEDEDLLQSGYEGLLKALQRYDSARGIRFSTYASSCIIGEIRHQLRWKNAFDRPKWVVELQGRILAAVEKLLQENGRHPTLQEISSLVNIREEGVQEALRAGRVPFDEVDTKQIRSLHHESFHLPMEDRILLQQALQHLSSMQRRVIYLLFYYDLTQSEAAQKLGTTQRQISRLLHKSLESLARFLSK